LATESGISQDVFDKMAPAFTKLKENMQSVYKTEEHLSRVKQSKELGIDLNDSFAHQIVIPLYLGLHFYL
jgi:TRAP-type uncharacterized transport system substrate-binding protein